MRFDLSKFFLCDSNEMQVSLTELMAGKAKDDSCFALGSAADFVGVARVADEYARKLYPEVTVLEIDRSDAGIDPLYNEPVGAAEVVSRELTIHALVKYQTNQGKFSETGIDYNTEATIHFPIVSLVSSDWSPEAGDKFRHLGRLYGIHSVFVEVSSIHGNTGLPTFISANATQVRYGDGPAGVVGVRNLRPSRKFSVSGPAAQTLQS